MTDNQWKDAAEAYKAERDEMESGAIRANEESKHLRAVNAKLLAALEKIDRLGNEPDARADVLRDAMQDEARAAIAKAKEEQSSSNLLP